LVYWLGEETPLKALLVRADNDGETTGTEAEILRELPPPYGGLTADDEPGLLLETPSEELVIMGVEIAGDDPGFPVTETDCPELVLVPYTGG
jgi:hypothetical protein